MRYTVQVRSVEGEEWREVGTFWDAAYCMRLAEAHATAGTEARIARAIALVDAPPLCRSRSAAAASTSCRRARSPLATRLRLVAKGTY